MVQGLSSMPFERFFSKATDSRTRGHSLKLAKKTCTLDLQKFFFSGRVVNYWNNLSEECVSSKSVNEFKRMLDKLRKKKMSLIMDV